ncbi:hypothetical protein CK203_064812 [Vitis vinifera]|uniref:Uncharacterized protein n=1 Tax=Vitis vinifera TaxID=29760 RepID=A0A438G792_VITVI|nr:hypothetical protein CK203_064812 [Vitis vinifera]
MERKKGGGVPEFRRKVMGSVFERQSGMGGKNSTSREDPLAMAFLELFSIAIDKEALGKPNVGAGWGRGLLEPDVHKIDK